MHTYELKTGYFSHDYIRFPLKCVTKNYLTINPEATQTARPQYVFG